MARPKIRPGMRTVVARSVVMAVAAILVTQASAVTAKKTMVDRSMLRIVKNVIVWCEVVRWFWLGMLESELSRHEQQIAIISRL